MVEESDPPKPRPQRRPVKDPCERPGQLEADVDGDGTADLVRFDYRHDSGFIGVCTGDGHSYEVRGPAAETHGFTDIDGDRGDEIFVGGTTMTSDVFDVFVFRNGDLRPLTVTTPTPFSTARRGDPLVVWDGYDPYFGGEERLVGLAIGCEDRNGDSIGDLSQMIVVDGGDVFRWSRWDYTFRGTLAILIGKESGTVEARRGRYAVRDAANELVSPCDLRYGE